MSAVDINDLIGRPYRRGAYGPDAFDCWGLVIEVARRMGRTLPPYWTAAALDREQQRALMSGEAQARTEQIPGPEEGALAFCLRRGHIGVVLNGRVVHAARGCGVVSSSIAAWRDLFPDGTWHQWRA